MPYCPKCDMEFIEGVTVCSDCGGPLATSRETVQTQFSPDSRDEAVYENDTPVPEPEKVPRSPQRVYVKKAQKYEDMKSSASAFLLVGALLLIFSLVCWTGKIELPLAVVSKYMTQTVMTLMGVGCMFVSFTTHRSAREISGQIETEEAETKELVTWFLSSYKKEDLDNLLTAEFPDITPDELSLKRFELIQDYLVTNKDLPDQAYVDSLCEDIYSQLFEA